MLRTRPWFLFLVALVFSGACRCDGPGLGNSRGDFRPEQAEVNFGRVLEGSQVQRTVTLLGTGRAEALVTATAGAPFSVAPQTVSVPGGGAVEVVVVFTAGEGQAQGVLTLVAGRRTETVVLRGEGVRPLACVPSMQCREARFELEPGLCVETLSPDGKACIPSSRCQENGRCQSGECVGAPRTCNDDNPCTVDACSPTEGCVTSDVTCPQPSNPCRVGVCDRESGCGERDAADYTVCGPTNCKTANLCLFGSCRTLPTPEGFLCAPGTPCQGEGRCRSGDCVRPPVEDLVSQFSAPLGGAPVAEDGGQVLLSHEGALFASVCGEDAGCRLVSFTGNGLQRFEAPYPDGGVRTLLAVSDAGVLVRESEGLERYALASPGERLWNAPLREAGEGLDGDVPSTGVGRTAVSAEEEVVALVSWSGFAEGGEDAGPDGGRSTLVRLGVDGGVLRVGPVEGFGGTGARVALDEQGRVVLSTEGGDRVVFAEPADAGPGFDTVPLVDAAGDGGPPGEAGASLAVAGGWLFTGARAFASTDGGAFSPVSWGEERRPLEEPTLLLDGTGYAFARTCEDGGAPCTPQTGQLVLRALAAQDGGTRWEVPVAPPGSVSLLHEASLVRGGVVGTLSDITPDGGVARTYLQLFAGGTELAVCPLAGDPRVAGATHVDRFLYVVLEREGTWRLEAFDLGLQGQAETRGWPQRHGLTGTRRARP
ncbi:hypothetical protein POL68_19015 [Stigmatella sp. ncwal1]|uniref:Lipoprotein n=1 Tax=Stigmatella ashevillensis TaxID=2995309 RepID=A0ABT5DA92_9BACT|nr:hypothetical protein [Stigmatella ashevillena]MDC0710576.1 hypothetical protein [Stigmatella ashevillena]